MRKAKAMLYRCCDVLGEDNTEHIARICRAQTYRAYYWRPLIYHRVTREQFEDIKAIYWKHLGEGGAIVIGHH